MSGFSALVYEVSWTRLLALVIGPTTYAFATMAASFIGGIALGSMAGARLGRHVAQPALWLAGMLVTAAISASVAAWFAASRLPILLAYQVARSTGLESVLPQQVLGVVLLLLPASFALGATFTLALATASSGACLGWTRYRASLCGEYAWRGCGRAGRRFRAGATARTAGHDCRNESRSARSPESWSPQPFWHSGRKATGAREDSCRAGRRLCHGRPSGQRSRAGIAISWQAAYTSTRAA